MERRRFLVGSAALLAVTAAAACSDDDEDDTPTVTTLPGPGAGSTAAVLLRTGAALSLAAAALHQRDGGPLAATAANVHRTHVPMLDDTVTEPHADALATWATPADAELALAATFQAWVPVLEEPAQRRLLVSLGASVARLHAAASTIATGVAPFPEAFQLADPAVPDTWLLR